MNNSFYNNFLDGGYIRGFIHLEVIIAFTSMISRVLILISLACFVQAWTSKETENFKGFMNKYGFHYSNETGEFDRRMKIFNDNVKAIDALNKGKGHEGQYGINKFSAMTSEEFQQTMLMPKSMDPQKNKNKVPKTKPERHPRHKRQSIPTSYDYRDYGWVTPVRDQGQCGSCWAFTAIAALESNLLSWEQQSLDLSEQSLVDCETQSYGCNGGWLDYAIDHIQQFGVPLEANYPYIEADSGTCFSANGATYNNIDYWLIDSEADIPYHIYYYGPVGFYFGVPSVFQYYTGGVFDVSSCNNIDGYHEVTIVGYTPDYWIVKNSWGTGWGDDGYVYYKRGKNLCGIENELIATTIA